MHAKIYDRTWQPVVFDLRVKPQAKGFHDFVFVADGAFTADDV